MACLGPTSFSSPSNMPGPYETLALSTPAPGVLQVTLNRPKQLNSMTKLCAHCQERARARGAWLARRDRRVRVCGAPGAGSGKRFASSSWRLTPTRPSTLLFSTRPGGPSRADWTVRTRRVAVPQPRLLTHCAWAAAVVDHGSTFSLGDADPARRAFELKVCPRPCMSRVPRSPRRSPTGRSPASAALHRRVPGELLGHPARAPARHRRLPRPLHRRRCGLSSAGSGAVCVARPFLAGIDLIAACDIRVCAEDTFFSIKEVDIGASRLADLPPCHRHALNAAQGWLLMSARCSVCRRSWVRARVRPAEARLGDDVRSWRLPSARARIHGPQDAGGGGTGVRPRQVTFRCPIRG